MKLEKPVRHLPSLAPGPRGLLKRPSITLRKPKKTSTACLPCKEAKRKCTGRPSPCKACRNTNADCTFDDTLDLRRKIAARRTLGEMEHYRGLLHSLIESLRSADKESIQHILHTIRESSSLDPIAAAIETRAIDVSKRTIKAVNDKPAEDEVVFQQEWPPADPQSRITLEKLCDQPLFRVPAKPWTTVTKDDHLVSHLISLYFTWDHSLSPLFDQAQFLDHMATKETASEFCSPLLVNSILAVASSYSDFPEVFTVPGEVTSKGLHFYAEAESLWKAEEGQISLTNIQALCLMSYVLEGHGKHQASWNMLRQAVQLAQDFGMFQALRARGQAWDGATNITKKMSMECQRAASLQLPRPASPKSNHLMDKILWCPYPRYARSKSGTALLPCTKDALVSLSKISMDINDLLLDKALDMNFDEVQTAIGDIFTRLETWYEELRSSLPAGKEPTPQMLFIRIRYHCIVINLFGFLLNLGDANLRGDSSLFEKAKLAQIDSAKQIALYLFKHRELYGLRRISGQMLGATNASALVLVAVLGQEDIREPFVELCRTLVALSRRLLRAKSMLDNVKVGS